MQVLYKDETIWATRELVMNAICHRDYESNGPIQFYQYADRIEIENHGGLYGRANEQNFPNVNDYRNLIVAEGMKVLGFVNRPCVSDEDVRYIVDCIREAVGLNCDFR